MAAHYLAYIKEAEALHVNLGMEWIDVASRLIQWRAPSRHPTPFDPGAAIAKELSQELKPLSEGPHSQAKRFLVERNKESERLWTHATEEPFASLWTIRRKAQTARDLFRKRRHMQVAAYEMDLNSISVEEMRIAALLELEAVERGMWFSSASWFTRAETSSGGKLVGL